MTSIFTLALGADFDRLHPRMQERFGFSAADGRACIGTGVMERMWRGPRYMTPFLRLGTTRNILFPEAGDDVPFTIENYAYLDTLGRDTVTFVRTFQLAPGVRRRFDATMVHSPERGKVIDFLGTHQHVEVDLDLSVTPEGGLEIRSAAQRMHLGPLRSWLPPWLTGAARVRERFDDTTGRFHIDVHVEHPRCGPIFGYHGSFDLRFVDTTTSPIPAAVKPYREHAHV